MMMKLSLMKRFFDTVDEEWRTPLADQIARYWFDGEFQAFCLRASANFAIMVTAGEQDYILRFNHASERTVETIVAELAFIEHLSVCGVRVARPLPSLAGNLVESVMTDLGLFHSVLFEFLPGQTRELDELDLQSIEAWGQALGQVHQASQGLKIEGRLEWSSQIDLLRQIVPPSETVVWREAAIIEALLVNLPRSSASY
jgi:Ser/Thr protein kinase RdoA (MazF antagonist)